MYDLESFCKITNINEKHHDHQYSDGLNILNKEFEKDGEYVIGGLYITKVKYIRLFYGYGVNIRLVDLPSEDEDFQIVQESVGWTWRVNKLILKEKFSLFEPETYQKFNLDPSENRFLLRFAIFNDRLDVLDWWYKSNFEINYDDLALSICCYNNNVNFFNWCLTKPDHKLTFKEYYLYCASKYGHVDLLQWWLDFCLKSMSNEELIKTFHHPRTIDNDSAFNDVNVLQWWSDAKLKYGICGQNLII